MNGFVQIWILKVTHRKTIRSPRRRKKRVVILLVIRGESIVYDDDSKSNFQTRMNIQCKNETTHDFFMLLCESIDNDDVQQKGMAKQHQNTHRELMSLFSFGYDCTRMSRHSSKRRK